MYVRLTFDNIEIYFTYKFFNRFHDLIYWSIRQLCYEYITILLDCSVPSDTWVFGSHNSCSMPSVYNDFMTSLLFNLADSSSVPFPDPSPFEAPF